MGSTTQIRRKLSQWYVRSRRTLPWRETVDVYRIWVSEIMLQQTRVAAVLSYYRRFIERFPDVSSLAAAGESELLAHWSGLGYYSRARNMHKAARMMVAAGGFPREYEQIRKLPGIGDYTAAAVASIAFGLPHAVLDGNVMRVLCRLTADNGDLTSTQVRKRLQQKADALLDRRDPGEFNQAMMELGATVCLPREPQCLLCPLSGHCEARRLGLQDSFPAKKKRPEPVHLKRTLLVIEKNGKLLLGQRPADSGRMAGFWELPEDTQVPGAHPGPVVKQFRHTITHHHYRFLVRMASIDRVPKGYQWVNKCALCELPLSTATKKALSGYTK